MKIRHQLVLSIFVFLFSIFNFSSVARAQAFTELHSFNSDTLTNYSSLWLDVDQDYDLDVLQLSILNKPNQLYLSENNTRNKTNSVFQKDGGNANGACYADIDRDGDLDVFVYSIFGQKNCLYIQEAKGLFRKENTLDIINKENNAFYACFTDVDLDNDPDLLITDTELWNPKSIRKVTRIYYNDGTGKFSLDESEQFMVPKSDTRAALFADLNQDAREDLLLINFGSEMELYLKNNANVFNKAETKLSLEKADYMDALSVDIDNDGDLDVLVATVKSGVDLFINEGHLTFTKTENVFGLNNYVIAGIEALDWNKDGQMDIMVHKSFSKEKRLFINKNTQVNWVKFYLRADRSNINGIQAKVYVKSNTNDWNYWQMKEVRTNKHSTPNTFDLHFGVGALNTIDSVKVIWPDGTEQYLHNLSVNTTYFIEERKPLKTVNPEHIDLSKSQAFNDINISAVADRFRFGEITGITLFYENKGLVEQDVDIDLKLSEPMKMFNSFPMPNSHTETTYHWQIPKVPAQYRGIITLSVRAPNIEDTTTKEQKITLEIFPSIGDENVRDNEMELLRSIE
jgi:hypothetical protein